jgi:hypothetical protein
MMFEVGLFPLLGDSELWIFSEYFESNSISCVSTVKLIVEVLLGRVLEHCSEIIYVCGINFY